MKRHNEDIDGMLEDIREDFLSWSKSELVDSLMDYRYGDKAEESDIRDDYRNFIGTLYI